MMSDPHPNDTDDGEVSPGGNRARANLVTCPSCSVTNAIDSRFCSACGTPLVAGEEKTVTEQVMTQPVPSPASDSSTSSASSSTGSSVHGRFLPGTRVADRYRIVSLLGHGGMGEVYRADDLKLGHPVALKFLSHGLSEESHRLERFLNEVRLSRQLAHPNVCRVYDVGEVDGQHFLSMEYIDGEDLKGLLRRIGRLPRDKGIQVAQQICAGLVAAHEKGVLHRDLKPANIMIDGRGQARITDFGLARLAEGEGGKKEFAGTPAYMAPEQLNRGETSVQSDLYSLGLILYELFTGQAVHQGASLQELLRAREETSITPPPGLMNDLDPAVERVILRCLERETQRRPKSARVVAAGLPGGDPLTAALAAGETPSPEMVAAAGGEGALSLRVAVACLAAVVLGLLLVWRFAESSHAVNRAHLGEPPQVLARDARQWIARVGYDYVPTDQAQGFLYMQAQELQFWYRQQPTDDLDVYDFWSGWGELSHGAVDLRNPRWEVAGETGLRLTSQGQLRWFRAIPAFRPDAPDVGVEPDWDAWFPEEVTGFSLTNLPSADPRPYVPPDAFDRRRVWQGTLPGATNESLVTAASFQGRPVHFEVRKPWDAADPEGSATVALGRSIAMYLTLLLLVASMVLAWRNYRLGRSDRRGAFRVAFVFYTLGLLISLLLAGGKNAGSISGILDFAVAQAFWRAGFFWLFYTALEPFVRRLWPQALISWSRLLDGRLRDPLVGQNLLIGALLGVVAALLWQIPHVAREALGLSALPPIVSSVHSLGGTASLLAAILVGLVEAVYASLFATLVLLFLRFVCRKPWFSAIALVGVAMIIWIPLAWGAHPILGGLVMGLTTTAFWWAFTRLGLLAAATMLLTSSYLHALPLTTDWSAWYAGHGFAGMALVLGIAAWGFHTAKGSQPLFPQDGHRQHAYRPSGH